MFKIFKLAIFAGIAIAVGGTAFLRTGGIEGAVMFSFGLITVIHYGLKLYTGTAGFITRHTWVELGIILVGNIVGCAIAASLVCYCLPFLVQKADAIADARLELGVLRCGLLGIGCGMIMTTAVQFARQKKFLPLLFGVPVFIMCGFTHCVADAFYYSMASADFWTANYIKIIPVYLATVMGNLAGCNLYRIFVKQIPE